MSFDTIKLEKGLYSGKGFSFNLEKLDPSENYRGTALEGLDAFSRQLKRFNIKVSGPNSDTIDKFFSTSDSAALFPEYISRAVATGRDETNVIPKIVAATTKIQGMDYRSIVSTPSDSDKSLMDVGEGAFIPETNITTQENLITLKKRGRMLVASYEAIRFQRLDVFTVMLKQIGAYMATQQLNDAINVIINGDGNNNACENLTTAASALAYSDLVDLWNSFAPYEMSTLIASPAMMSAMLNLTEFKDAAAGLNFHATGKMITPLGSELIKASSAGSSLYNTFDKVMDTIIHQGAYNAVGAGCSDIEYSTAVGANYIKAFVTLNKIVNDTV